MPKPDLAWWVTVVVLVVFIIGFVVGDMSGLSDGRRFGTCAVRMEYAVTASDSLRLVRDSACVLERKPAP